MKIEDLPPYIKKYARKYKRGVQGIEGIKVTFPFGYVKKDEDFAEQPNAKKWLKEHGFKYMYAERGYWYIEQEAEIK